MFRGSQSERGRMPRLPFPFAAWREAFPIPLVFIRAIREIRGQKWPAFFARTTASRISLIATDIQRRAERSFSLRGARSIGENTAKIRRVGLDSSGVEAGPVFPKEESPGA